MYLLLVALSTLLAPALSRPQEPAAPILPQAANKVETPPIPIIHQSDEVNPDGSFQFSYETGNGIKVEEKGYVKDGQNASEKIQVIEGTVTYTDIEGKVINLRYIADENGYQAFGDHIPQAPVAPQSGDRSGKSLPVQSVPQSTAPVSSIQDTQPKLIAAKATESPVEKPAEQLAPETAPQPAAQPAAQSPAI